MIRVAVFDLGGVFFQDGTEVLCQQLPPVRQQVVREILQSPMSYELRAGRIDDHTFWAWAETRLPQGLPTSSLQLAWYQSYMLHEDVRQLVLELKSKLRVGIFSGNIASRVQFLDDSYHFLQLFDFAVWSFETGLNKGDSAFVHAMVQACACDPQAIAYVDNRSSALMPAAELGVHCFLYNEETKHQMRSWFASLDVLKAS